MNWIKNHVAYIKTINNRIWYLFLISLTIVLIIHFWLLHVPEPEWFGQASEFGDLFYRLGLSFISAFIFFYLNVHIKSQEDKAHTNPYITSKAYVIVGIGQQLINTMASSAGVTLNQNFPSRISLDEICGKLDFYSEASVKLAGNNQTIKVNWLLLLKNNQESTKYILNEVFRYMYFIDPKVVKILTRIEENNYFINLDNLLLAANSGIIPDNNIVQKVISHGLEDYMNVLKDLENYANIHLSKYKNGDNKYLIKL